MSYESELLARLTLAHKQGNRVWDDEAYSGIIGALSWHADERSLGLPGPESVTAEDTLAGLNLLDRNREHLDRDERLLIEAAKDRGVTWERLGERTSMSAQAMQQRYKRLGGTRSWPTPPPRREKKA